MFSGWDVPRFAKIVFTVFPKVLVFLGVFDSGWSVLGFPRYLFMVLPKMLVSLGIFDMVDEMCLVFPDICSWCSQKCLFSQGFLTWWMEFGKSCLATLFLVIPKMLVFPRIFDLWAEYREFSFLKSACFPRHSWHSGWNVPSFPRYLFTVLRKNLVFLGFWTIVNGIWRVLLGHSVRRDPRNACFPRDFSHSGWSWASLSWLHCSQCSQKCLFP